MNRKDVIAFSPELLERRNDPYFAALMNGTQRFFDSRREVIEGQRRIAAQRMAQSREQIAGSTGMKHSISAQIGSIRAELASLQDLLRRGLITRPRILQLERSIDTLNGQMSDVDATIARLNEAIIEQRRHIDQLDHDRLAEVTRDLRDVQSRVLEVLPKLQNAKAVLERTQVRSPYSGTIVALNAFSVGGVIGRGEKILDIVPDEDALILEAQIPIEDIAEVRPRQTAEVTFAGARLRHIPKLRGEMFTLSADRITDQRTGSAYFVGLVRLDAQQLKGIEGLQLYPGMAATVMLPTVERTALDYLLSPLTQAFNRSLRER